VLRKSGQWINLVSLKVNLIVIAGTLVLNNYIDIPILNVALFVFFVLLVSRNFSEIGYIQSLAISSVLIISLSPTYLVARGLFTKSALTSIDLEVYLSIFLFISTLFSKKINLNSSIREYHKKNLNYYFSAFSSFLLLLVIQIYLVSKSFGDSVAWVMSGDSKGHVVFSNNIAEMGWLDPATFLFQPISAPSFMALYFGQSDLNSLKLPSLLANQLEIYSLMWILMLGLIGVVASGLAASIWNYFNNSKVPTSLIFFSSLLPFIAVISGVSTNDGFFTALLSISAIGSLIIWLLEVDKLKRPDVRLYIIGLLICLGTVMSWMFVAMFTIPLTVLGIWTSLRKLDSAKLKVDLGFSFMAIFVALGLHFSTYGQTLIYKAKLAFGFPGVINSTKPELYLSLIFVFLLLAFFLQNNQQNLAISFFKISIVGFLSLVLFKYFGHLGLTKWNYYLLKYQWILTSAFILVLAPYFFVRVLGQKDRVNRGSTQANKFFAILVSFSIVFFLAEGLNPTKNAWLKMKRGWENPRNSVVNQVLSTEFDRETATLFFHHGYQGDSMLANFWLTAYLKQQEPLKGWNYTIDTEGDEKQLCDVASYYGKVRVITYDPELENQLKLACPEFDFEVTVESQPS
jgi:hypothetical protein